MIIRRTRAVLALALTAASLHGCAAAGPAAVQLLAPIAVSGAAVHGAEERKPFGGQIYYSGSSTKDELAILDAKLRRANCGDAESQYWLASTLDNGLNETPNKVQIYKWYRLAELGGVTPATQKLAALDVTMSPSEITEARARASEWRPSTADCPPPGG